jgi:hypothetical protein
MRTESPNGGVNQRLAGGKWIAVPTSVEGKNGQREGSFGRSDVSIGGERERASGGPSSRRWTLALSRNGKPSARAGFPCSWVADRWASVRF